MATQYNVNLIGSLTNTNGVLSGFSTNSNYATFSGDTFNNNDVEIVFKTNFNRVTGDGQICYSFYDSTKTYSLCDIGITSGKFYFEITNGTASLGDISGTTTVIANTDYYIKAVRNNTTYTLYSSTNGTNWTTEGTLSNITFPSYTSATNYIGGFAYDDNGLTIDQILDGTVDLNESYIKVGGQYVWRGVTNTTTIQLRRDTSTNWSAVNPILANGEVGIETDTRKQKFGDGSTAWNSLAYSYGDTNGNFDGQWVNSAQDIISTAVSLNGTTNLTYTVTLPNDGHIYEVMIVGDANTGTTIGNWFVVCISSNVLDNWAFVCGTATQGSRSAGSQGTVIIPMTYGTNNLTLRRNSNYNGTARLQVAAYRRLGTNT